MAVDMTCSRGCCPSQADHYRSVVVRPLSPRGQQEKTEAADMAAYKRLRQSGEQPKAIAGSAELERRATTSFEVKTGHVITDKRLARQVDRVASSLPPEGGY